MHLVVRVLIHFSTVRSCWQSLIAINAINTLVLCCFFELIVILVLVIGEEAQFLLQPQERRLAEGGDLPTPLSADGISETSGESHQRDLGRRSPPRLHHPRG